MNLTSLVIGILIGVVGAFATGFLRKGGEDVYYWIKGKISPGFTNDNAHQVVVNLNGEELATSKHFEPVEVEHFSQLTFDEIQKAIDSVPPLQQEDVARNYVGLYVEWITYLQSAYKKDDQNVFLRLSIDKNYQGRGVLCEVPREEYSELSILQRGSKIRISGEIVEASPLDVKLSDVRLKIISNKKV